MTARFPVTLHVAAPTRADVDLPAEERQFLSSLLRRASYLALRYQAEPSHVAVRRELDATIWAVCTLGGTWGLAVTEPARTILTQHARLAAPGESNG
jgi:hypothetical protein